MTHKQKEKQDVMIDYGIDRSRMAYAILELRGWCLLWMIATALFAFLWICEKWFW